VIKLVSWDDTVPSSLTLFEVADVVSETTAFGPFLTINGSTIWPCLLSGCPLLGYPNLTIRDGKSINASPFFISVPPIPGEFGYPCVIDYYPVPDHDCFSISLQVITYDTVRELGKMDSPNNTNLPCSRD
jgi:hypothetical protein